MGATDARDNEPLEFGMEKEVATMVSFCASGAYLICTKSGY